VIERSVNDLRPRSGAHRGVQRAGQIDPIETQYYVGAGDGRRELGAQQDGRRRNVQRRTLPYRIQKVELSRE